MRIREIRPGDPARPAWEALQRRAAAESGAPSAQPVSTKPAGTGAPVDVPLGGPARGFVVEDRAGTVGAARTTPDGEASFVRLFVAAEHRRRGNGTALLDAVRAAHPGAALKAVVVAGGPGEPFATRFGATVLMRLTTMTQRLDDLPPCPAGEVAIWHGDAPPRWTTGYTAVRRFLADAPGSAHQNLHDPDRPLWVAAVIADGAVVAITEVETRGGQDASQDASQKATVVLPEWRGHGLALVAKLALAHHLHRVRPDLATITTTINEANAPMATVNRLAGYRPVRTRLVVALS